MIITGSQNEWAHKYHVTNLTVDKSRTVAALVRRNTTINYVNTKLITSWCFVTVQSVEFVVTRRIRNNFNAVRRFDGARLNRVLLMKHLLHLQQMGDNDNS